MPVVETIVAYSDFISSLTAPVGTVLIEYSNARDFDGLIYSEIDPVPVFYLRVPGRFFDERVVEENESEGLTNKRVQKTMSSKKTQRLLELDYMTDFMHTKLQGVLQHIRILKVDGVDVVYEGGYNKKQKPFPGRKYSQCKADVWLTLDGTYVTNVL